MLLSLKQFIEKHTGESVANPEEGSFKGECVSLCQMYIYECHGIGFKGRGNAKDYCNNLIKEGLAVKVTTPQAGDIMGWNADSNIGDMGHVAIFLNKDTCFDQSNGQRKTAQKRKPLAGVDIYVRMKHALVDDPETEKPASLNFKVGDKVVINGNLYVSSNAADPSGKVTNKVTEITRVADGAAHPYNTTGDLGWMNESDITLYAADEIKKGDKVKVLKAVQYDNGKPFAVYHKEYDVIEVAGDRVVIGVGKTVTAAVDIDNLKKVS